MNEVPNLTDAQMGACPVDVSLQISYSSTSVIFFNLESFYVENILDQIQYFFFT